MPIVPFYFFGSISLQEWLPHLCLMTGRLEESLLEARPDWAFFVQRKWSGAIHYGKDGVLGGNAIDFFVGPSFGLSFQLKRSHVQTVCVATGFNVSIGSKVASKCSDTLPEPGWISQHFAATFDPINTMST